MKKSIGLIESKGLVALIEATDVILKNSPVEFLWVKKLNNGLVTLAVSGETEYVKAALEMAVESANKVGEVYSYSVIENPDQKLLDIFEVSSSDNMLIDVKSHNSNENKISLSKSLEETINKGSIKINEEQEDHSTVEVLNKTKSQKEKRNGSKKVKSLILKTHKEPNSFKPEEPGVSNKISTLERLRREALGIEEDDLEIKKNKKEKIKADDQEKDSMMKEIDLGAIENMNVHDLRRYARAFTNFPIKGRQISLANRNELVELFKKITS